MCSVEDRCATTVAQFRKRIDRLIQQATLQVLQERWDPTYSAHSYGLRPGRSPIRLWLRRNVTSPRAKRRRQRMWQQCSTPCCCLVCSDPEGDSALEEVVTRAVSPWNKGKLIGQKAPFKLKQIWATLVRVQIYSTRELTLFDLGINSKLRACDLVKLKARGISHGVRVATRATVLQKTSRPVQFEITEPTRPALDDWIKLSCLRLDDHLFPSRIHGSPHLNARQYARILDSWVEEIGVDPVAHGNVLDPQKKGDIDLSTHQELACGPTGSNTSLCDRRRGVGA
jgi:hypothetical protein